MSAEPVQGALASVMARCASAPTEPDSGASFFGRIPCDVMPRRDLGVGPKFLLGVLDAQNRRDGWRGFIDATDEQLAAMCGANIKTIGKWLADLVRAGLIAKMGHTCRRIIKLLYHFRAAPLPPKTGGSDFPQKVGETSPQKRGELPPKTGGNFPQKAGVSSKVKEEKNSKAPPSSSSSPEERGTTTTAKTADTPPASALPPLASAEVPQPSPNEARWDALPETERLAIEAEVKAAYPWAKGPFVRALGVEALAKRPVVAKVEVEEPPAIRVEVLDDAKLGSLAMLAHAEDPIMRSIARAELASLGRQDVFATPINPVVPKTRPARRPDLDRLAGRNKRSR